MQQVQSPKVCSSRRKEALTACDLMFTPSKLLVPSLFLGRTSYHESLILFLFLAAAFSALAQTNASTNNTLHARIEKARAEKKIDARLNAFGSIGASLSLAEIPEALNAAENLKSLREQLALRDTALKRWLKETDFDEDTKSIWLSADSTLEY
jgi:hypothetical protein